MNRALRAFGALSFCAVASALLAQADYPLAKWVPADSSNFTVSNRPSTYPINYIVIHVTQGSYQGAINWFQNPSSNVSAHFVARSSDGDLTQMVREKDVGWHAGNWNYNTWSVGIEHEGFVSNPAWFTPAMYESSAKLSRYLSLKYGFARDRNHIIGHVEVPGATHTDPGQYWNWDLYMDLVRLSGTLRGAKIPVSMEPGRVYKVYLLFKNTGDTPWPNSGPNPVRLATSNPPDHASPFYSSRYWLSPSRVMAHSETIAPDAAAVYQFTLTAPSTPGFYTESLQLVKEGIGRFGPIVQFSVAVGVADTVLDNDGPNFEAVGTWSTGNSAPGHYGADYRYANTPTSNYANWYLNPSVGGYYDVYAWWSQGTNRTDAATYRVSTAQASWDYVVNQQASGGQWNLLGRHYIPAGDGFVRLLATGPSAKVAIADAVRFVGPFPNP